MNIFNRIKSGRKTVPPIPEKIFQDPFYFIAFGLGSGAIPFAPGTFGTLFAIPFYLLLQALPLHFYFLFVIIFIVFSMWVCDRVSKEIKIHDHPGMTIDEFAGFFVTMISAPRGALWVVLGFVLFRLFDVTKPWPIRFIDQKVSGGLGIVLDDVLAGVYACFMIQIIRYMLYYIHN
ncbi:MAG: phosphatidylglycerophosphatase [Gammaproteobacteria bacterium RIFCSPHIGHO2_12_FULL_38_14]|nr:MAG: phosphatidylglycerophosphatase [Gammaproteobacteria bacterium RIFCSPHIGHO2_12_FULL_38_14]